MEGYESHYIMVQKSQVALSISCLPPHLYNDVAESMLRVYILNGTWLKTVKGEF